MDHYQTRHSSRTLLSTHEVVDAMRRRGLRVSAESLRQDVQRHLVVSGMPDSARPGRGRDSLWTPMAVRRVALLARLRRLRANGHVIPLLAFLGDGWGWQEIRGEVAEAVRRQALVERRSLNRPSRVRQEHDLLDNVDQSQPTDSPVPAEQLRRARRWLASVIWYGRPSPATDVGPYLLGFSDAIDEITGGHKPDPLELRHRQELVERLKKRRDELTLTPTDLADWLATLDNQFVERGRRLLRGQVREFRHLLRHGGPLKGSSNPLTEFGKGKEELAAELRHSPGRPTAAQLLATLIGQAMFMAAITAGIPEFE